MKHLRLYRGGIAVVLALACAGFALVLALRVLAHLVGMTTSENWMGLAWASAALFLAAVTATVTARRSIALMASSGRGLNAFNTGQYAEAEARFRQSWELAQALADDDPCRGDVLEHLVRTARAQGNYDDAESFGKLWLSAQQRTWGDDALQTLHAMEELADIYLTLARFPAAEELIEKALAIRLARGDSSSIEFARSVQRMGQMRLDQNRADLAEPGLHKAFTIVQQCRLEATSDGLAITRSLTLALIEQNRVQEAAKVADAAFASIQQTHTAESWPVANGLLTVALVRLTTRAFAEAEQTARNAFAIAEKTCGKNRPALRDFHRLLAVTLQVQEKWTGAEEHFRQALQLCEEYLAPIHPELANVLEQYAEVLSLMGRRGEADNYTQRARQIRDFHAPFPR